MEPRHQKIAEIALGSLTQKTDTDFDEYGVNANDLHAMRARFANWRTQLN